MLLHPMRPWICQRLDLLPALPWNLLLQWRLALEVCDGNRACLTCMFVAKCSRGGRPSIKDRMHFPAWLPSSSWWCLRVPRLLSPSPSTSWQCGRCNRAPAEAVRLQAVRRTARPPRGEHAKGVPAAALMPLSSEAIKSSRSVCGQSARA